MRSDLVLYEGDMLTLLTSPPSYLMPRLVAIGLRRMRLVKGMQEIAVGMPEARGCDG